MRKLLATLLMLVASSSARADILGDILGDIFGDMPISKVMSRCDTGTNVDNFSYYKTCVINTYSAEGNRPNSPDIKAFYSQLDVIDEYYRQSKISNAEAKAFAYQSWQSTIDNPNQRSQASEAAKWQSIQKNLDNMGRVTPAPTSPFSSYRIDGRTYNCTDIGGQVNCR
jgi:hypothetical protein